MSPRPARRLTVPHISVQEHPTPPSVLRRAREIAATAALTAVGVVLAHHARHGSRLGLAALRWLPLRAANQRRIRTRCTAIRISDDVALCRVLGRYKMFVEAGDHGHAAHLMLDGYWEMPVTQVVAGLVRPGMSAVDIGANQGYYTLLLAGLVGRSGTVHAVEPNGRMLDLLRRSLAVNELSGRVRLHQHPLGSDDTTRVVLRIPPGMPSGAYLEPAGPGEDGMPTTTLDALLGDTPVDVIKIDAEGAEMAIWQGMAGILDRRAPLTIIMEFLLDRTHAAAAFLEDAQRRGFSLSHVDPRRGLLPITSGEILAGDSSREWMLVLQRGSKR